MALPTTDVLNFLQEEGLIGGSTGWAMASNYMPDDQNQVVAVFDTPGERPDTAPDGSTETEYDYGRFQVRVRGAQYGGGPARTLIGQIYRALHNSNLNPTTGDPVYIYVYGIQSSPLPLGLDDASRPGFSWNFEYMRERETD